MSQSLYTAMSGITAATTDLEVISNNIANVNTTGYKSSSVNFSDVYYDTLSSGSVASSNSGGTNPEQVGVGTQVSSITKDFTAGSATATSVSTDLMIEGTGFFTVQGAGNTTYYTRAGDFSFDDSGNLVTSDGYKVLGTDSISSSSTSTDTVKYPTSIVAVVEGNTNIGSINVSALNSTVTKDTITEGTFSMEVTTTVVTTTVSGGSTTISTTETVTTTQITLSSSDVNGTVSNMISDIESQLQAAGITGVTITCADGEISFSTPSTSYDTTAGTKTSVALGFTAQTSDSSNFIKETGLSTTTSVTNSTTGATTYSSTTLDETASLSDSTTIKEALSESSVTIQSDGSLEVTYSDGSVLSVELGSDGTTYQFVYTTADDVSITGTELSVNSNLAEPANFVIQLATVTNTDGLIQVGSNLYEAGANSGDINYTTAGEMSAGTIKSNYLESSNVDLSTELSKMILAQRAVEANSRVFTTSSDVLSTIVQMGR